jgi:pilus assembly protein Flp/PilA
MSKIMQNVKQFLSDEEGVTAIEYGLIAALIGVAISGTVMALGGTLNSVFSNISGKLTAAI